MRKAKCVSGGSEEPGGAARRREVCMGERYSRETERILEDFVRALAEREGVDGRFLAEVRQMTTDGALGDRSRIRRAVSMLKGHADELPD